MIEISEMADVSLSHALFYMRERERERVLGGFYFRSLSPLQTFFLPPKLEEKVVVAGGSFGTKERKSERREGGGGGEIKRGVG